MLLAALGLLAPLAAPPLPANSASWVAVQPAGHVFAGAGWEQTPHGSAHSWTRNDDGTAAGGLRVSVGREMRAPMEIVASVQATRGVYRLAEDPLEGWPSAATYELLNAGGALRVRSAGDHFVFAELGIGAHAARESIPGVRGASDRVGFAGHAGGGAAARLGRRAWLIMDLRWTHAPGRFRPVDAAYGARESDGRLDMGGATVAAGILVRR